MRNGNYFSLPNEIFSLRLGADEIAVYAYLLFCEARKSYQCYLSYQTIGHAVGMSTNTVRKYIRSLEDKGFIYTEPTTIWTSAGQARNGNLRYTIRPINEVVKIYHDRQLRMLDEAAALQKYEAAATR